MPKWKHTKENLSWMQFSCTIDTFWFISYPWGLIYLRNSSKVMMLVTWCTAESTGPGTRRPNSSLGFFHSPRQTKELPLNAYEEQRSHLHGPPHGTLRIKRDALCEGSFESISKAIKSSHLIGWKEPTILKSQNQILRDKKKKRNRRFLWIHPYFFPFISLHFEVISQHYKQEIRYFHSSWPEMFLLWKEKYLKNVERCCPTTQGKCQFSFLDSSSTY